MPLSPHYGMREFPKREATGGGTNPGVWDVKARITGGPTAAFRDFEEKAYFAERLPKAE